MEETIEKILKYNINLFGDNPTTDKINVGFTNTIYKVNDAYIVKICTNIDNEENFKKEIEFYNKNKTNDLIPKLYYSNTDKKDIPYFYEIIEKIDGVSLYNVWHTFSDEQREEVIKKICQAMKNIHKNKGSYYNWTETLKNKFNKLYEQVKELNIFNQEEISILEKAYLKFDEYLESSDFVLVHNDLHFDNIFYNDGEIKIIDFERSLHAPRDFELDIIYRMVRKPCKFASEETEKYTNIEYYSSIMNNIEKYYPEIFGVPHLYKRLAIYDMIYFLRQVIRFPNSHELKTDILAAAKTIV